MGVGGKQKTDSSSPHPSQCHSFIKLYAFGIWQHFKVRQGLPVAFFSRPGARRTAHFLQSRTI